MIFRKMFLCIILWDICYQDYRNLCDASFNISKMLRYSCRAVALGEVAI